MPLSNPAISFPVYSGLALYVDPANGSDTTGTRGRRDKPFATCAAAQTAASSGDCVILLPGAYNESGLGKQGVNWYLMLGVRFNIASAVTIFSIGVGSGQSQRVEGLGEFIFSDSGAKAASIAFTPFDDHAVFEFLNIETVSNGAVIQAVGNCTIRGKTLGYTSGRGYVDCTSAGDIYLHLDYCSEVRVTGNCNIYGSIETLSRLNFTQPGLKVILRVGLMVRTDGSAPVDLSFAGDLTLIGAYISGFFNSAGMVKISGNSDAVNARFINCVFDDNNTTECIKIAAGATNKKVVLQGCHLKAQLTNSIVCGDAQANTFYCEGGGSTSNKPEDSNTTMNGSWTVNSAFP